MRRVLIHHHTLLINLIRLSIHIALCIVNVLVGGLHSFNVCPSRSGLPHWARLNIESLWSKKWGTPYRWLPYTSICHTHHISKLFELRTSNSLLKMPDCFWKWPPSNWPHRCLCHLKAFDTPSFSPMVIYAAAFCFPVLVTILEFSSWAFAMLKLLILHPSPPWWYMLPHFAFLSLSPFWSFHLGDTFVALDHTSAFVMRVQGESA